MAVIPKSPVLVIDVSRHDPLPVDWKNDDPNALVAGVFAKFSQGDWWKDPTARQNADVCRRLNIPFGGYHFFEADNIKPQADKFINVATEVGSFYAGRWQEKLAAVLDQEYTPRTQGSVVGAELAHQVWTWIDMIEQRTGSMVELYSSAHLMQFMMSPIYWTRYVENGQVKYAWLTNSNSKPHVRSGTREGWWAQYFHDPNLVQAPTDIPAGWESGAVVKPYKFWQYTDNMLIQGLPSHYDANQFNGTLEEWHSMVGGTTPPPPATSVIKATFQTIVTRR